MKNVTLNSNNADFINAGEGRSRGRLINKPKVFAASAAEDFSLENLPLRISLPGDRSKAAMISSFGK